MNRYNVIALMVLDGQRSELTCQITDATLSLVFKRRKLPVIGSRRRNDGAKSHIYVGSIDLIW